MKDPSDLYVLDPANFVTAINAALAAAKPWSDADRPSEPEFQSAQDKAHSRAASNLRFRTAREIAEETPENPNWYVEGYVAACAITEFSGKIKAAGKTTLLTHMARAITVGGAFLGRETTQTRVVYLTEQPSASFREALRRAGLLDSDDVIVLYWRDTVGTRWPKVVERAIEECRARDAGVLVVDTLPKFAGLRGDAENNAGDADEAMEPLQIGANDGLAVVLARHERKAGGEVGDSGRGSTAFGGGVDIVLSLKRQKGGSRPGVRELSALSRFDETPEMLVIELTNEGYVALGDERAVVQADARRDVLAALPNAPEAAVRIRDLVARAGGASRTTVQRVLDDLLTQGAAAQVGDGVRGDPYRYHSTDPDMVTASPSAHTAMPSGQTEATSPCYACGTTSWVTLDDGWRYCGTCHPSSVARPDGRETSLEWPG